MVIRNQVCDRCGKPFEYSLSSVAGYFVNGIRRVNKFHFRTLWYGAPTGYEYSDHRVELCKKCTEQLLEFLRGEQDGMDKR